MSDISSIIAGKKLREKITLYCNNCNVFCDERKQRKKGKRVRSQLNRLLSYRRSSFQFLTSLPEADKTSAVKILNSFAN